MHEQDVSRIVDGAANRLKRKSLAGLQTRKYCSDEAAGGPAGGGTRREKVEGEGEREREGLGTRQSFFLAGSRLGVVALTRAFLLP